MLLYTAVFWHSLPKMYNLSGSLAFPQTIITSATQKFTVPLGWLSFSFLFLFFLLQEAVPSVEYKANWCVACLFELNTHVTFSMAVCHVIFSMMHPAIRLLSVYLLRLRFLDETMVKNPNYTTYLNIPQITEYFGFSIMQWFILVVLLLKSTGYMALSLITPKWVILILWENSPPVGCMVVTWGNLVLRQMRSFAFITADKSI